MITTMTSRERLLAAINLEEPDHIPLWCMWTHEKDPFNRKDERTRIEATLPLGLDETIRLNAPWRISPEVKVSAWSEPAPGEDYRLLHKRYETPAGVAEQVLRSSEYISTAGSISVMGNLNMSHGVKCLLDDFLEIGMDVLWGADPVQGEADLPLLMEKLQGRMCI